MGFSLNVTFILIAWGCGAMRTQLLAGAACLAVVGAAALASPSVRAVVVDAGSRDRLAAMAVDQQTALGGALSALGSDRVSVETALIADANTEAVARRLGELAAARIDMSARVQAAQAELAAAAMPATPVTVAPVTVRHTEIAAAQSAVPAVDVAPVSVVPQVAAPEARSAAPITLAAREPVREMAQTPPTPPRRLMTYSSAGGMTGSGTLQFLQLEIVNHYTDPNVGSGGSTPQGGSTGTILSNSGGTTTGGTTGCTASQPC